jgi:hypothetical protein
LGRRESATPKYETSHFAKILSTQEDLCQGQTKI